MRLLQLPLFSSRRMASTLFQDILHNPYFFDGKIQNLTDSQTRESFEVHNPATGELRGRIVSASDADVDKIAGLANKAQPGWENLDAFQRGSILNKAADSLIARCDEIAKFESLLCGKTVTEAAMDVMSSAQTLQYFSGVALASLKGEYYDINGPNSGVVAYTRRVPYGVVGCIGPWNYPLQTCIWKVAPALATGNTVVYKPSPLAALSPVLFGVILAESGLPPNVYNVLQGEGGTGQALCLQKLVRKLSFTGSIATGLKVQQLCAQKNLKPVTLELGGKSALVIFADSDFATAVEAAHNANFINQGQVCTNATRVFVERPFVERFTAAIVDATAKLPIGDPLDKDTKVGPMVSKDQMTKVEAMVRRAVEQGAVVLTGGTRAQPSGFEKGYYLRPTILSNVTDDMDIAQEEIFGPVMLIMPFDTEEEAVQRANNTDTGLAAGVVTGDATRAHRVSNKLEAGTVYINSFNDCYAHVPFGGLKDSGYGRENCVETIYEYSQIKTFYKNFNTGN